MEKSRSFRIEALLGYRGGECPPPSPPSAESATSSSSAAASPAALPPPSASSAPASSSASSAAGRVRDVALPGDGPARSAPRAAPPTSTRGSVPPTPAWRCPPRLAECTVWGAAWQVPETPNRLLLAADRGAGAPLRAEQVPVPARALRGGNLPHAHRDAGEDLVPESAHEVEEEQDERGGAAGARGASGLPQGVAGHEVPASRQESTPEGSPGGGGRPTRARTPCPVRTPCGSAPAGGDGARVVCDV
ncbi:unnamed protein product [Lampetra planeri]